MPFAANGKNSSKISIRVPISCSLSKDLKKSLIKLSVIIPSRDEAENLPECISKIAQSLSDHRIENEILVIDDGSTDNTAEIVKELIVQFSCVKYIPNKGENGFGRATRLGLQEFSGDAVAIMMADLSDSPQDLVRYWQKLQEGHECVFGSRFMPGGQIDYPKAKLLANRIVNTAIRYAFKIPCNDITNAFKIYRREVIEGAAHLYLRIST